MTSEKKSDGGGSGESNCAGYVETLPGIRDLCGLVWAHAVEKTEESRVQRVIRCIFAIPALFLSCFCLVYKGLITRMLTKLIIPLTGNDWIRTCFYQDELTDWQLKLSKFFLNDTRNYLALAHFLLKCVKLSLLALGVFLIRRDLTFAAVAVYLLAQAPLATHNLGLHYAAHKYLSDEPLFRLPFLGFFNQFVICAMEGWVPLFWPIHHVMMHHVEDNNEHDRQSVTHFRRCFVNYLIFLYEMPIQWYFRVPTYFWRKGDVKTCLVAVVSELIYVGFGIALSFYDFRVAVMLFWFPHVQRIWGNSIVEYGQHSLVNPDDPKKVWNNSYVCLRPKVSGHEFESEMQNYDDRYHMLHHSHPNARAEEHHAMWTNGFGAKMPADSLVFNCTVREFLVWVITEKFDLLAKCWSTGQGDQVTKEAKLKLYCMPFYTPEEAKWIKNPGFPFNCMAG